MFGIQKFPMEEIQSVDLTSDIKTVTTLNGEFKAKSIIIATGAQSKNLVLKAKKNLLVEELATVRFVTVLSIRIKL